LYIFIALSRQQDRTENLVFLCLVFSLLASQTREFFLSVTSIIFVLCDANSDEFFAFIDACSGIGIFVHLGTGLIGCQTVRHSGIKKVTNLALPC
jgi:hypothetical protein